MDINIFLAFGAGFLSFISPCCLPLYPAFLSYITGMSTDELQKGKGFLRSNAITHTLFFLAGFSIIFIVIGFSTSWFGSFFIKYDGLIRQLSAILIILFGLFITGLIKPSFLMKNMTFSFKNRPSGFIGSSLIGMGFAAGWTPCTGPILAGVIALGITNPDQALVYMMAYVLGFSVPFLLMAFFIGKLKWMKRYSGIVVKVGGYIMILMGIVLFFDWLTLFTSFLTERVYGGFTGF